LTQIQLKSDPELTKTDPDLTTTDPDLTKKTDQDLTKNWSKPS